jgi:hypothetical protein
MNKALIVAVKEFNLAYDQSDKFQGFLLKLNRVQENN